MPRNITVIGAGQAGLCLALGLQQGGYDVTVVADRTPNEIESGRILSNQCTWHSALQIERDLGINFWDDGYPIIPGFDVHFFRSDREEALNFPAPLSRYGQSVDQRLKFPRWMRLFEARGGRLVIQRLEPEDLEDIAADSDLVILGTGRGRGRIRELYQADPVRNAYDTPQRVGASIHVRGRIPDNAHSPEFEPYAVIPDVGEFWIVPATSVSGPCHILCLEGVPGGPLDCWDDIRTPQQHLEMVSEQVIKWLPWEAERCRDIELVDDKAYLSGGITPEVRMPVITLPSRRCVLGIGDAVLLNDPISQQGANTATKAAYYYLKRIIEHGERPFDRAWMTETAENFWQYAVWSVKLTHCLMHPPAHWRAIFEAASTSPALARLFADGNDHPPDYFPWLADSEEARRLFATHRVTVGA